MTRKLEGYEIFRPFYDRRFKDLTAAEARKYLEDYVTRLPERMECLARTIALSGSSLQLDYSEESIAGLGEWLFDHVERSAVSPGELMDRMLKVPEFLRDQVLEWQPTPETFSLGYDVGGYLALALIREVEGLHWAVGKGGKTSVDYNMPMLVSANRRAAFNPISVASTIILGFLKGTRSPDQLAVIYKIWRDNLSKTG